MRVNLFKNTINIMIPAYWKKLEVEGQGEGSEVENLYEISVFWLEFLHFINWMRGHMDR